MKAGEFKNDLTTKKFDMLTPLKYIKGGKWECLCDCGNITIVDTRNLNSGHTTSCGCKIYSGEYKHFHDITGYENNNVKVLYKDGTFGTPPHTRVAWRCLCKRCGNTFLARSNHILSGEISSCGCLKSKNESNIARILTEHGIEFATQYTFPDLKGKKGRALRFDFAIFTPNHELSHLIEYNGEQHYKTILHGTWSRESLEERQSRDQKKIDYCKKHGIPLIIIPYNKKYTFSDLLLNTEPVETIPG